MLVVSAGMLDEIATSDQLGNLCSVKGTSGRSEGGQWTPLSIRRCISIFRITAVADASSAATLASCSVREIYSHLIGSGGACSPLS